MNAKTKDLCDRLRGIYTVPITDGNGPINGKDHVTRKIDTPPIGHEAAKKIEELEAALEAASKLACSDCQGSGMTDGWIPSYNDPDNSGCHPSAEPCPKCHPNP